MEKNRRKIAAVDFDGTLCKGDKFPNIGKPNDKVIRLVKKLQQKDWAIILWTCRCGVYLDQAVEWCVQQGIYFDCVNEPYHEQVEYWKSVSGLDEQISPKIFADLYIDDRCMNAADFEKLTSSIDIEDDINKMTIGR